MQKTSTQWKDSIPLTFTVLDSSMQTQLTGIID
jgi:hypothetical protein